MQEINLYDLIKYYAKKWRIILAFTLVGLLGGVVYDIIQTPLYRSNAKLLLVSSATGSATSDQTRINNYIDLIKSRRVLEPVIDKQRDKISYEALIESVQATNQKGTEVIDVTVTTASAEQSKEIANDITGSFKSAASELYENDNVVVIDPAVTASSSFNVNRPLQAAVSTLAGLTLGIVILFFLYDYNQTKQLKSKHAIQKNKRKKILSNRHPQIIKNQPTEKSRK